MEKPEGGLFDGIDLTVTGLAPRFAGSNPPAALTSALAGIADSAQRARQAFDAGNDAGTVAPIEAGLTAVRALRGQLASMGLSDAARYEIDFRLKTKEQDYQDAVLAAHGLALVAIANDGLVTAGEPVQLSFAVSNRGPSDVAVTGVDIAGFTGASACNPGPAAKQAAFNCTSAATVPQNAKLTEPYFTEKYWKQPSLPARSEFDPSVPFGVPFAPTPFRATFKIKAGTVDVVKEVPVEFRYVKDLYFGDKKMELNVVPAFSVQTTPALAVFPAQRPLQQAQGGARAGVAPKPVTRDVFVTVTNSTKAAATVQIALELPEGWKAAPVSAPLTLRNEDESLSAKFVVTAPVAAKSGEYTVRAVVTAENGQKYSTGYQVIEYPHVQRRHVIKAAETLAKVIDVQTVPNVKVGYVMGVGDQVPPAIEQLGGKVTMIEQDELAWGDLSKYDVIMTGVRAYERRGDLRAYNRRLLDYVQAGGTMIVNYNKTEFNAGEIGRAHV